MNGVKVILNLNHYEYFTWTRVISQLPTDMFEHWGICICFESKNLGIKLSYHKDSNL